MDLLDDLLLETSRTFALAIPLLPEPTRRATGLAYLLFRVSDTVEDAAAWSRDERVEALRAWCDVLCSQDAWDRRAADLSRSWRRRRPSGHDGYLRLIERVPDVLGEVRRLGEGRRAIVIDHAVRSAEGMADVLVRSAPGGLVRLTSLEDLKAYCYAVAGIVGELLTSLFLCDVPALSSEAAALRACERAFGEGLQLVNILKDEREDAAEGRRFLPPGASRGEVIDLAREDLARAAEYTEALRRGGAPGGFVAFTAMPAELARASLERIEEDGPGAKVPRAVVLEMMVRYRAMAAGARG
jgi:farnesyl-diphosphate farnesyltransferase